MNQPRSVPPLSPFRIAEGQIVFLSGQLPRQADGSIVDGGMEAQAQQAMDNLSAVLSSAGLDFSDIVKTTVWITDPSLMGQLNAVYERYFPQPFPARSVVVSGLVAPGALLEIEAIACRG